MRRMLVVLAAALAVLAATPLASYASYSFDLTYANPQLDSQSDGPYATVFVDLTSSTTAFISITAKDGFLFGDGGTFGVNATGTGLVVSNITTTDGTPLSTGSVTTAAVGSQNVDGWGLFNVVFTTNDGFNDALNYLSFTLTSTSTWASALDILGLNSNNVLAVAHIFPCDPGTGTIAVTCTGTNSLATGFAAGNTDGPPPVNDQPVPEPSTLLLLGGGLIAFAAQVRRRSKKQNAA